MIISHTHKFVFIHIQRTGGTSTVNMLKQNLNGKLDILSQHGNAKSKENFFLAAQSEYFIFSFVRNPWDRILSWYLLLNKNTQECIEKEKIKFERFLDNDWAFEDGDPHFHYNQLDYLEDESGQLVTDKIYRFEAYADEIQSLQNHLNLPIINPQKINDTWAKNYRDYYTEKSRNMISEKCKRDIEYFKYTF